MKAKVTIILEEELRVFTLLYCANADFKISYSEYKFIESGIKYIDFDKLFHVFRNSNDYQIINRVESLIKKLNYSKEDRECLFEEIRDMFRLDGTNCILKRNLFRSLKRFLK